MATGGLPAVSTTACVVVYQLYDREFFFFFFPTGSVQPALYRLVQAKRANAMLRASFRRSDCVRPILTHVYPPKFIQY